MKKAFISFVLAALIILTAFPAASFADEMSEMPSDAKDISKTCTYSYSSSSNEYLRNVLDDNDYSTGKDVVENIPMSISWENGINVSSVLIEFKKDPPPYIIKQYDKDGNEVSSRDGLILINDIELIDKRTRKISIITSRETNICGLKAYGPGKISDRHKWNETPEKLDYMVIATHPDDDVLFLGAIVPIYTGEYGLTGTSMLMVTSNRGRKDEALNGEWVLGMRNALILANFPDYASKKNAPENSSFNEATLTLRIVQALRKHKPEVVFTQDVNGEYGHWQHRMVSKCVSKAVTCAKNENFDPESVEKYGTWEVKKLYVHLHKENQIKLNTTVPLRAFNGETAEQIATRAFACHQSQQNGHHYINKSELYDLSAFGLAYTTVGYDTPGVNNPFEHISTSKPVYPHEIIDLPKSVATQILLALTSIRPADFLQIY